MAERQLQVPLRTRLSQLRASGSLLVQLGVGAGLAWFVATALVGHVEPFFAPIAAVVSMLAASGRRQRAAVQLVAGVAVGVLVGELLILVIGRGAWQVSLVVALAYGTTLLLGLAPLARMQAVTSAILLATVTPAAGAVGSVAINRFVDALVGGALGLGVTVLLPANAARVVEQEVGAVLGEVEQVLRTTARALRWEDAGQAWTALQHARALNPQLDSLDQTIDAASEVSRLSPFRWHQREHVVLYAGSVRWIDYAVRDTRVLARRVSTLLRRSLPVPAGLADAVSHLADAVQIFAAELAAEQPLDEVRAAVVKVAREATRTLPPEASLSVVSAVAQVRAVAADLVYATGSAAEDVDTLFEPDVGDP